jgi:hypothetical protein
MTPAKGSECRRGSLRRSCRSIKTLRQFIEAAGGDLVNPLLMPQGGLQRIIQRGGRVFERPGRRFLRLEEPTLLATAQRRARWSDFGMPAIHEPLHRLLQSIEAEARLNLMGRIAARENLTRVLTNRLMLERDRQLHPAIAAEEIRRPLFIAGLPRSGSTLLHNMLAQDPANRVPLNWETLHPSPPPERVTYATDPRMQRAEREIRWFARLQPAFRKIHAVGARFPEECLVILSHTILSFQFSTTYFVPSYHAWFEQQDPRPAYQFHRRFLQHLQWRCPGERWVLKAPTHWPALEALLAVYPDAGVILTHRDPLRVVASVSSLHAVLRSTFSDAVEPTAVGPEVSQMLANDVTRGMQALDRGCVEPGRVLNVWYTDLVGDPMATVRRIYAHFDLPLSPEVEARMREYVPQNLQGREQDAERHEYSLEQFGLDADCERQRYRAYCTRFGLC